MYNFKFNYLSRGQLVSLNLDKFFLPSLKILPCYEVFFCNLIFAIIARMLRGNHLNPVTVRSKQSSFDGFSKVCQLLSLFTLITVIQIIKIEAYMQRMPS